MKLNVQEVER